MKRALLQLLLMMVLVGCAGREAPAPAPAPVAAKHPVTLELHDDRRVDDYFWLRERDDPAVIAYLKAENAHSDQALAKLAGQLMGAVINRAPELYNGVFAGVPFVDVVTTMLDADLPLTSGDWDEWGNPNQKDYYDYMLSYSPYDNVRKADYPNLLVTTGLHDSQVQYREPAKWPAKLRDYKTDDKLLSLKTDMAAGHSGAAGRFRRLDDTALYYAFFQGLEGIRE